MKYLHRVSIIVGALFLVILTVLCIDVFTSGTELVEKTNTLIQGIYTFVTTVLVILTFSVLIVSKEQNYQSVKPDLVIEDIDLIDDERSELDYYIYNTGKGKAYNIMIKIFKDNDIEPFYLENCPSLDIRRIELIEPLYGIVNALNDIRQEVAHNSGYGHISAGDNLIYKELHLPEHFSRYYNITFSLEFEDSYSNEYKNTFIFEYDLDEREYILRKELHSKIENFIKMIKKAFK